MTRPALLRFVAVILAAGAGAAVPASAQDRLFIGTGEIGSAGRFGERIGDAPAAVHGLFVDGGRIVVDGTMAFDTLTGRSAVVPGRQVLAGDPLRPRVFTYDGQMVASVRVDTGQLSPLISAQPTGFLANVSARYAPAAGLLFVHRGAAEPKARSQSSTWPAPWWCVRSQPDGWVPPAGACPPTVADSWSTPGR